MSPVDHSQATAAPNRNSSSSTTNGSHITQAALAASLPHHTQPHVLPFCALASLIHSRSATGAGLGQCTGHCIQSSSRCSGLEGGPLVAEEGVGDNVAAAARRQWMSPGERRLSQMMNGGQMRSMRLIGKSKPRYQWERYWKTEEQLKAMPRKM